MFVLGCPLKKTNLGNENYDWYELQRNAMYKNGYSADHPTVRLFWEVFHDLSHEQKKMFLLYLTGSDRIPILGMNAVKVADVCFCSVVHSRLDGCNGLKWVDWASWD